MRNINWEKSIAGGFVLAIVHFVFTWIFFFAFGLGMDPEGAKFFTNIWIQPGNFIINAIFGEGPFGIVIMGVNLVSYFVIGFLLTGIATSKSNQSLKRDEETAGVSE